MQKPLVVRAIDVGYGHVKFSDGRDANGAIRTDSFPSQSPAGREGVLGGGVMHRRDVFLVEIKGRRFDVGKQVSMSGQSTNESEVLDQDFALSDAYAARLMGALAYMTPSLRPELTIDYMVLGLPLNTFQRHARAVAAKFTGPQQTNVGGDTVTIRHCEVYPQPLGAYMTYLRENAKKAGANKKAPMALVVDPGYNTVDWFVCQGMAAAEGRSNATVRGMSAVLRATAEALLKDKQSDATVSEIVRRLDASFVGGQPFTMYGKPVDISKYCEAGQAVIDEAIQAVKNSVGSGSDIDVIVVAGGGTSMYTKTLQEKFPNHEVVTLANPAFANVRGFQLLGEKLAISAGRANPNA